MLLKYFTKKALYIFEKRRKRFTENFRAHKRSTEVDCSTLAFSREIK